MARMRWLCVLTMGAILILPASSACSLKEMNSLSKHVITVDDEPGDADYTSIKEALNHSSPGDTIEVYSGTYMEHAINITNRFISLIGIPQELGNGSDTGKPFINGQARDNVIHVKAPNVTISGFRIENRGTGFYDAILISYNYDGCVISNNTLSHSEYSIVECYSNNTKIINNTIKYAGMRYGIELVEWNNTLVSHNIIDHCPTGIDINGCSFCTIVGNRISNCSICGIDISGYGITCQFNTIENNSYGLHIYVSRSNQIKQNNFINNTVQTGFYQSLGFTGGNWWSQNYWERPRKLPYPIVGTVFMLMPWVQFDWRPAQQPYDILETR